MNRISISNIYGSSGLVTREINAPNDAVYEPEISKWPLLLAGKSAQTGVSSGDKTREGAEKHFQTGIKFSEQKKWREAAIEYRRALAIDPSLEGARTSLIGALEASGNVKGVEAEFKSWLKEGENSNVQTLMAWAGFLTRQKRFTESIEVWNSILAKDSKTDVNNLYHMALAYMRCDRVKDAVPILKEAASLDPKSAEILKWLGNAQYSIGKKEDAIATWKKGIDLAPHEPTLHYNLGKAYFDQARFTEAALEAEEALLWKHGDGQIEELRAKAERASKGEVVQMNLSPADLVQSPLWEERPLAQIDEMISKRGVSMNAAEYGDLLRGIIFGQRFLDATLILKKALIKFPDSVTLNHLQGDAFFGLGRFEDAIRSYEAALKFEPDNEKLKGAIKRVQAAKEKQLKPAARQLP